MGKLIEDLKCSKPEQMNSKILEETTAHYKYTDGGVHSMCRAFEEYGNEIRQKYEALLNIKDATISEKEAALSEKDATICEKDATIASIKSEKDAALSEKDAEIAFLKAELEKRMKEELAQ